MSSSRLADVSRRLLGPAAVIPGGLHLIGVGLIDSVGTGLYLAGSAVFFSVVVRLTPTQIGIGLSVASVLGLVAQPFLGWLADRWGPRRVLVLLHLWRAAAFTALAFSRGYPTFVVAAAAIGVGQQALSPVYQAFVAQVAGADGRVAVMARTRVVYNVGFSLGGLLATAAIASGARAGFMSLVLGNAASCLLAAVVLSRLHPHPSVQKPATAAVARGLRLGSLRDGKYLSVAAVNGFLSLHISLLGVGVPLWVTLHTAAPTAIVGVLLVVNIVFAVLFQVRASRGSETVAGSVTALRRGAGSLVLSCALFALAALWAVPLVATALLVAGVIALTGGEVLQSAGGWGLSYALAPEENRSEYLSSFNLGTSAQYVLGPTIVTVGVMSQGLLGWLALAAAFTAALLVVKPLVTMAEARREPAGLPEY